jgi:LmbE family N-acetylglucosaminyl deacetylase
MIMQLSQAQADIHVPDETAMPDALARTTHLCVGAHQDDQEFMAYHGIVTCFAQPDKWFTGVAMTNGGGSPRSGPYERFTDDEMMDVRRREQRKAADLGEYACQVQLFHPSSSVKDPGNADVVGDLKQIFEIAQPEVLYLHNPADKHDTHVGSVLRAIEALRQLPADKRPSAVYGCEIWRSLDWLNDDDKVVMPVDAHKNLAASLSGVFDSQITGGKRYDTAIAGRRTANATFFESHATDKSDSLAWGMDLTRLVQDDSIDVCAYTVEFIDGLRKDVIDRIGKVSG